MDKKSFKAKQSFKKVDLRQEKIDILDEKYQKIKDILKQVLKDLKSEREKGEILQKECVKLAAEIKEKNDLLGRMQSVSEAVVDEFSALKVKCELEATAANNAIKRATRYYQENQILKRDSQPDLCIITNDNSNILSEDSLRENISELEILNKLNSDLRTEIAYLKTQLNKEIQERTSFKEDFETAKSLYEQEVKEHKSTAEKLKSLELTYNSVVQAKDSQIVSENHSSEGILTVQDTIGKSVNFNDGSESKIRNSIGTDITATLADMEEQKNALRSQVKDLERKILNIKLNASQGVSLGVPPPPPPPPPPPSFNPIKSLITFINAGRRATTKKGTVMTEEVIESGQQKAMSEMINAIKKGNIQLKPVPKVSCKKENESEPIALVEMKSILETLKKRERFGTAKNEETKSEVLDNCQPETAISTEVQLNSCNETSCTLDSSFQRNTIKIDPDSENNQMNSQKDLENHSNDGDLFEDILLPCYSNPNENEIQPPEDLSYSYIVEYGDNESALI